MTSRLTSIVIPCYGELPYTELCVESIQRCTPEAFELILVDNGSPDRTREWAQEQAAADPRIRVLPQPENLGFARGVNAGLDAARGSEYLVLNNDAVVTEGWLARLRAALDESPEVGIAGPVCNQISGPQQIPVPYDDDLDDMAVFAARWASEHANERQEAVRIVGFCMLVRQAVVDRIGGFDPRFGNGNFEDDDFCLRAMLAGWKLRIARDCFVHHFGSRTFLAMGKRAGYRQAMVEGFALFQDKWDIPDPPEGQSWYDVRAILERGPVGQAADRISLDARPTG